MTKFLIIFALIIAVILLSVNYVFGKIRKFSKQFQQPFAQSPQNKKEENVVYEKDDVIVLKGEAKQKDRKDN